MPPEVPWGLNQNLALMAGAGTGKTHSLITLCLHLLAGARTEGRPLPPERLRLLTFTEKAAGEMKERLHRRVARLATSPEPDGYAEEPVLAESFAALGLARPARAFWEELLLRLSLVGIGTFHAFCIELLREADPATGGLRILGEWEAQTLLRDAAERAVIEALERGDRGAVDLCEELSFAGRGRAPGLVDSLMEVLRKVRDEGGRAQTVSLSDPDEARRSFELAVSEARSTADEALSLLEGKGRDRFQAVLQEIRRQLESLTLETAWTQGLLPAVEARMAETSLVGQARNPAFAALKSLKARIHGGDKAQPTLRDHFAAVRAGVLERAFVPLLDDVGRRYHDALQAREAVDFSELLISARDRLRDDPAFRAQTQSRLGALLVDEFQDTNHLQWELVSLLSERREGAPRAVAPNAAAAVDLPLEPGFLCIVGDYKQSIYEFRGADVSVFRQLADRIEEAGGRRVPLRESFRSTPSLIRFFNRVSRSAMGSLYQPDQDDLISRRPEALAHRVERMVPGPAEGEGELADAVRRREAEAVARRLEVLFSNGEARPGEVAILFRRLTYVEPYVRALTARGIPHRVRRGRGFFAAPEVVDAASMLSLLGDADRSLAFAAVLRSPWVGLSDRAILALAVSTEGRLSLDGLLQRSASGGLPPSLSGDLTPDEVERLERFLALYRRYRIERLQRGVASLLRELLQEGGLRSAWAALPAGGGALSNLDRLCRWAECWDEEARGDCDAFAREVLERGRLGGGEDDVSAGADAASELELEGPGEVQILTVHASKGLEFPVVLLPDLAAPLAPRRGRVLFDRWLGLSIRPLVPDSAQAPMPPRHREICSELDARERSEHQRLLYVAMTRARDRLIVADAPNPGRGQTWSRLFQAAGAWEEGGETSTVFMESVPPPARDETRTVETGLASWELRVREAVDRVASFARQASPGSLARRQVELGWMAGLEDDRSRELRAAQRHLLLGLDWSRLGAPGSEALVSHLRSCLRSLPSEDGGEPSIQSIIDGWLRVAGNVWGRTLADLAPWRIRVVTPFCHRLREFTPEAPEVVLRGEIDLLLQLASGRCQAIRVEAGPRPEPANLEALCRPLVDGYRLAASRLLGERREARGTDPKPVTVGIVFLGDPDPVPVFFESAFDDERFVAIPALLEGAERAL